MNEVTSPKKTAPIITVSGSHREIGLSIGERFAKEISDGLAAHGGLQDKFLPFHRTSEGKQVFDKLIKINQSAFPDYFEELESIAKGAGVSFEEIFIINLRGEYRGYIDDATDPGCSTCIVNNSDEALIIHNEDGLGSFRDKMYFIEATPNGKPSFTTLSYPGFLPGNAFGFNSNGICFSVNNLRPSDATPGLARHFLCRSLFEATSIEDAIARVTPDGRAAGFHYSIGSIKERRIVTVETAPNRASLREESGSYFHPNHYIELKDQGQRLMPSTQHRQRRAEKVLAEKKELHREDALALLGDGGDSEYPIYRVGAGPDLLNTLCTAEFNLDTATMRVIFGHPLDKSTGQMEFSIPSGK